MQLADGVLGVVLNATRGLRLHDRVHLLAEHGHKAQRRGERERVAIRNVKHLDAGVGQVVELGHAQHEDERQCHAQKAQACLAACDQALRGHPGKHGLAAAHKRRLQQKHHHRKRHKQLEQRNQLGLSMRVGTQRKGEDEKPQQHGIGVCQEDRDDDCRGNAQFGHGVQPMQQGVSRHVVDHVNHGEPSPW